MRQASENICKVCGSSSNCVCQQSLVRFFELLLQVEERVSPAALPALPSHKALIDKISFKLEPTPVPVIRQNLRSTGISCKETVLRDRKLYLQVENGGTFLKFDFDRQHFTSLITNPSSFPHISDYTNHLEQVLGTTDQSKLTLTRLDLTLDYNIPFNEFIKVIDVEKKQTDVAYDSKAGKSSSIRIGRGSDKLSIYDKQREARLETPLARLERQISGRKLPARKLDVLIAKLKSGKIEAFNDVHLQDIFYRKDTLLSDVQKNRLHELKVLIENNGYLQARKKLNTNDNFKRDYLPLIKVVPWAMQPTEAFSTSIANFLN